MIQLSLFDRQICICHWCVEIVLLFAHSKFFSFFKISEMIDGNYLNVKMFLIFFQLENILVLQLFSKSEICRCSERLCFKSFRLEKTQCSTNIYKWTNTMQYKKFAARLLPQSFLKFSLIFSYFSASCETRMKLNWSSSHAWQAMLFFDHWENICPGVV